MLDSAGNASDDLRDEIKEILAAASPLGIEINEEEAIRWILAVSSADRETAFAQDLQSGIFGNRISLLDFETGELAHFRRLARRVRAAPRANVEAAIAIAGSAAQGKVQLFPGDNDFFERVNIRAASLDDARQTLRDIMRETALRAFAEPNIVLVEVNFGVYAQPVIERGSPRAAGDPITWAPQDVLNGYIVVQATKGEPITIKWGEAQAGLGWTYLGWIVADPERGRILQASNMLDVTWEAPDGTLTSLDGSIDPFFQEIYLEPAELPIFTKIASHADPGALNAYISSMRSQVFHYTHEEPNYGKASKRLYNLFRLTDQFEAAAYLRELFDEPAAQLYQVSGLLEAADIALHDPGAEIDRATVLRQIDLVEREVQAATEGTDESSILAQLARLRREVMGEPPGADWEEVLEQVRQRCAEIINDFFRVRLFAFPQIKDFIDRLT